MRVREGLWLAVALLGLVPDAVRSEDVPRESCAFLTVAKTALEQKAGRPDDTARALGANIRTVKGAPFDLRGGGMALRAGEQLRFASAEFVFAGEGGIASTMHKDMGPLAFYAVQEAYLLHGVTGVSSDKIVGRLVFEYEDGSTVGEDLVLGENIGSPTVPAEWAKMVTNGFCVTTVQNPVTYEELTFEPGKGHALKSLTVSVSNKELTYRVAAITCKLGRQRVHE